MNSIEENQQNVYLEISPIRSFCCSLLNSIFVLAIMFTIYFSVFVTYKNTNLKDVVAEKEQSYSETLNIAKSSGLYKSNDSNTSAYSSTNYYELFVATLLQYDYNSPEYDMETDNDGYKNYSEKFEPLKAFTIHDGYIDDSYLGNFYTHFVIDRINKSGDTLVSYNQSNAISYYIKNVLKANDSEKGGQFFDYVDDNTFPHLKSDVRYLLFGYNIKKIILEKNTYYDNLFYAYFVEIFNEAQQLLLNDKIYSEVSSAFETSNNRINEHESFATYISLLASVSIVFLIFPLFNKHKKNFAQLLLRVCYKNEDDCYTITNHLLQFLGNSIKNFYLIFFICLFGSMQVLTNTLFSIGSLGIGSMLFVVLTIIIDVISIFLSLFTQKHRNFESIISGLSLCSTPSQSSNNKPSDIVSE